jgi:hypothetical protein
MASLNELLIGVEGLAILRTLYDDDAAFGDRVRELRDLLSATDDAPSSGSLGVEYDLQDGYRA